MFDPADNMGYLKIMIVDHVGQMIQTSPVVTLNDMVLFQSPLDTLLTTNEIGKIAAPLARDL